MPIYDRPIDSSSFQPMTTASSMENYGAGNMALDMGLAIGIESLGAGLMGAPGMFGGKPLMGYIPGVSPGAAGQNAAFLVRKELVKNYINTQMRGVNPANMPGSRTIPGTSGYRAGGLVHTGPPTSATRVGSFQMFHNELGKSGLSTLRAEGQARGGASAGLANRLGIGMGLRAFSQAWIVNDLFSLGFSAASGAIQGIESFSYERRAAIANEGGLSADLGDGFADTRASFTQRQRAMQAIHNSQMNTRAAMGNEATFMHV